MQNHLLTPSQILAAIEKEVRRSRVPPIPLVAVTMASGLLGAVTALSATHQDAIQGYILAIALLILFVSTASVTLLYQLRFLGRGRICRLLGSALESDRHVAIKSWALTYRNLDLATQCLIRPHVHRLLEEGLSDAPDIKALHYPVMVELLWHWNDAQKAALCQSILKYLAQYGSADDLVRLKPSIRRLERHPKQTEFKGLELQDRAAALQAWESRIAGS